MLLKVAHARDPLYLLVPPERFWPECCQLVCGPALCAVRLCLGSQRR